jgi:hypothetical protein
VDEPRDSTRKSGRRPEQRANSDQPETVEDDYPQATPEEVATDDDEIEQAVDDDTAEPETAPSDVEVEAKAEPQPDANGDCDISTKKEIRIETKDVHQDGARESHRTKIRDIIHSKTKEKHDKTSIKEKEKHTIKIVNHIHGDASSSGSTGLGQLDPATEMLREFEESTGDSSVRRMLQGRSPPAQAPEEEVPEGALEEAPSRCPSRY